MARIRTLKPEFWTHEDLSAQPEATHLLAAALLNHSDDGGYFNANPALIKAAASPLREPSVSIQDSLSALAKIGYLALGSGPDGKRYGRILKFDQHQVVNRPTPSKIKALQIVWESSESAHGIVSEYSVQEGKGKEGNREGKGKELSSLRSDSSSGVADDASKDVEKPEVGKPELKLVPPSPADRKAALRERLREVSQDACETYNEILAKPNGLLASVRWPIGEKTRTKEVKRCLENASQICRDVFKSPRVTRAFWESYFTQCAEDPHKSGRLGGGKGHENWLPDFEYLTRPDVMLSVFEKAMAA